MDAGALSLVRPNTDDFSVFVGDLAPDVTDYVLQETFRQYYPSVRSAKVIVDPATGRSKGYGFVRFSSEAERDRSLEMQGLQLSNRPIRVSLATARRSPSAGMPGTHPAELDPTNTTLFIGGLSAGVTEEQLRAIFARYGDVVYTKIPQGKGCGFVQFVNRADAEVAMSEMNGQVVGSGAIRISWGRSTSRTAALQAVRPGAFGGAAGFGAAAGAAVPGGIYAPAGTAAPGLEAYGAAAGGLAAAPQAIYAAAPAAVAVSAAPAAAYDLGGGMYGTYAPAGTYTVSAAQPYAFSGLQLQPAGLAVAAPAHLLAASAAMQMQQQQQQLHPQQLQHQQQQLYDPLSGVDITKLNAVFLQRQQPPLTGGFIRPAV